MVVYTGKQAQKASPRQLVIDALTRSTEPLDAYQVAKASGLSPMQVSHTLSKLSEQGLATPQDDPGSASANALAVRYRLVGAQPTV